MSGSGNPTNTPHVTTGNPKTCNDAVKRNPLGTVCRYKGDKYMYVQFNNGVGNVAMIVKAPLHWMTLDPTAAVPSFVVTSDQTDALFGLNGVAGLAPDVIVTDLYYCWIHIAGERKTDATIGPTGASAGDKAIGSATDLVFGKVAKDTAPSNEVFAIVKNVASSTGPTLLLKGMDMWD